MIDRPSRRSWLPAVVLGLLLGLAAPGRTLAEPSKAIATGMARMHAIAEDGRLDAAIAEGRSLLEAAAGRSEDEAWVRRALASVLLDQGDRAGAARELRAALPGLGGEIRDEAVVALAELELGEGNDATAVALLEPWLDGRPNPPAAALVTLATARARLGRFAAARAPLEQALALEPKAPEAWHRLHAAVLCGAGRASECARVLARLVASSPGDVTTWRQLVGAHLAGGDAAAAAGALETARALGVLREPAETLRLIRLELAAGTPMRAAERLAAAIESSELPADATNLDLLATAWLRAREEARAIPVLEHLASVTTDGRAFERLARVHARRETWIPAAKAAEAALARGGLADEGSTLLVLGIAYTAMEDLDAARTAFERASRHGPMAASAKAWLETIARRALGSSSRAPGDGPPRHD